MIPFPRRRFLASAAAVAAFGTIALFIPLRSKKTTAASVTAARKGSEVTKQRGTLTGTTYKPLTPSRINERVRLDWTKVDGPNYNFACPPLRIKWVNGGGDYLDKDGRLQGPNHWDHVIVNNYSGVFTFNRIGPIVAKMLAEENFGFLIHLGVGSAHTGPWIDSHVDGTPPLLTVTTSAGQFTPPLVIDVYTSGGYCLPWQSTLPHMHLLTPAILRFDLTGVRGMVKSATLRIAVNNAFPPIPYNIYCDYLQTPRIITDPTQLGVVEQGIAAKVTTNDLELANSTLHPSVLFYPRNDSANHIIADYTHIARYDVHGFPQLAGAPLGCKSFAFVTDGQWAQYGLTGLRVESWSKSGDPDIWAWCVANGQRGCPTIINFLKSVNERTRRYGVAGRAIGNVPRRELYFRWLLIIDPDVDDGLAFDDGQPYTNGTKLPGFQALGFGVRMHLGRRSDPNPDVFLYEGYGAIPNDYPWVPPSVADVRAGQLYCMEVHARMNTVDRDGTIHTDGVIESWIDGVKVFHKPNMMLSPSASDEILEIYTLIDNGGQDMPEHPMHYEIGGIVVATEYIGPPRRVH